MSPRNLSASNKTHKFLLNKLKDKQTLKIYKEFERELNLNDDFIVAVSGGPDSLALSYLSKVYSFKKSIKVKYFIIDHKLRSNSSHEAKFAKKLLLKIKANLSILTWVGKKPKNNIQSIARHKRYSLLINQAKKFNIQNIVLGHQKDDLFENFFLRILRGSGLTGISSFDKKSQNQKINFIRPLLNVPKKDLENIAKKVFNTYVKDPSNQNDTFKRVKIRNFLKNLQTEGMDFKKFNLTIKNLKFANESIKFFTKKNLDDNTIINHNNKSILLNREFFNQPEEILFRSFTEVIKIVGKKYYPVRGKKIINIIHKFKNDGIFKTTLGNCVIRKVNQTIIVSKEH